MAEIVSDSDITINWVVAAENCGDFGKRNFVDRNYNGVDEIGYAIRSKALDDIARKLNLTDIEKKVFHNEPYQTEMDQDYVENVGQHLGGNPEPKSQLSFIGMQQAIMLGEYFERQKTVPVRVLVANNIPSIVTAWLATRNINCQLVIVSISKSQKVSKLKKKIFPILEAINGALCENYDDIRVMQSLKTIRRMFETMPYGQFSITGTQYWQQIIDIMRNIDSFLTEGRTWAFKKYGSVTGFIRDVVNNTRLIIDRYLITYVAEESYHDLIVEKYNRALGYLERVEKLKRQFSKYVLDRIVFYDGTNKSRTSLSIEKLLKKEKIKSPVQYFYDGIVPSMDQKEVWCFADSETMSDLLSRKYNLHVGSILDNVNIWQEKFQMTPVDASYARQNNLKIKPSTYREYAGYWILKMEPVYQPLMIRDTYQNFEALNDDICQDKNFSRLYSLS